MMQSCRSFHAVIVDSGGKFYIGCSVYAITRVKILYVPLY